MTEEERKKLTELIKIILASDDPQAIKKIWDILKELDAGDSSDKQRDMMEKHHVALEDMEHYLRTIEQAADPSVLTDRAFLNEMLKDTPVYRKRDDGFLERVPQSNPQLNQGDIITDERHQMIKGAWQKKYDAMCSHLTEMEGRLQRYEHMRSTKPDSSILCERLQRDQYKMAVQRMEHLGKEIDNAHEERRAINESSYKPNFDIVGGEDPSKHTNLYHEVTRDVLECPRYNKGTPWEDPSYVAPWKRGDVGGNPAAREGTLQSPREEAIPQMTPPSSHGLSSSLPETPTPTSAHDLPLDVQTSKIPSFKR